MISIKLNRKNLQITAPEERALRILKSNNFSAKKAEFAEGSGNYIKSILPKDRERRKALGITETSNSNPFDLPRSNKEKAFFKENPRCQSGIFGNPRRINAILKRLMELKIAKKPIIKWQVGWDDENIPAFGLEFFDSETEAQKYAESLDSDGETGIVLTEFDDDCPLSSWKLIDGVWE